MSFRTWTIAAISLFGLGIVLGLTVGGVDFITRDIAALQQLGAALGPFKVSTAVFIFVKNISTLLFSFLLSPVFCLVPILALTVNGWLLAFVAALAAQKVSLGFVLAAILPHGIIEIPALIIGEAAALSFGAAVIMSISKKKRSHLLPTFKRSLRYLAIAGILLVPAAIIETYVTPLLLR